MTIEQAIERGLDAVFVALLGKEPAPAPQLAILAAKHGRDRMVKLLLDRGCRAPLPVLFGSAVTDFRTVPRREGHRRALLDLVERGVDPLARSGWLGETVIALACRYGQTEVVQLLQKKIQAPNIHVLAALGEVDLVREAIKADRDCVHIRDSNGFTPLFSCSASGLGRENPERAKRLLTTALALIEAGADPAVEIKNEIPISPVVLAAWWSGRVDLVDLLVASGARIEDQAHQALRWSLEPHQRSGEPFFAVAEKLLQRGVDIERQDEVGRTLLHKWSFIGQVEPVRWMLAHGARIDARDRDGRTPLHLAAQRNTATSTVELLIAHGADLNAIDTAGETPLAIANKHKKQRVADYLRSRGAKG